MGCALSADPVAASTAFDDAFRAHSGPVLPPHAASEYDAVLLVAYGLAVSQGQGGQALIDGIRAAVAGREGSYGWDAAGVRDALAALSAADRSAGPTRHEVATAGLLPRRLLIQTRRLRADGRAQSDSEAQLLAVVVDVTELRRLETLRRDFVANASHELRTPVTALRSAAETLHDVIEADPPAAGRFLDMIERNAERLQHIIDDLLDLSRLESQTYRLELEPLDVAEVAGRVVELFAERARARQMALRLRLPADLPRVQADRRALEHVLCNLVDNAIKYGPSGGVVILGAEAGEHALQLLVQDSGPGIAAEHLPRLFERFYRVDAGRSRALGGTGLGLAIVKHLTEAMGGQVGVDSEPGRGTTFRCRLPLVGPESEKGPSEAPGSASGSSLVAAAGSSG